MTCQYGSKKRDGAKEFINPNDIGVLCSLFGLEGGLCRLLDLVPSAVKKIAKLNPDTGNSDEIFGDILKKFAKKSYQLVIDEFTGQINVEAFCSKDAPTLPEPITYYDVFEFFADLVPFVNKFLEINDVLIGNNTKLLDKIVTTWLYQQWFENCECKSKDPTPDNPNPSPEPSLFDESCPVGSSRQGKRVGGQFGEVLIVNGQVVYFNSVSTYGAAFIVKKTDGQATYVDVFPQYGSKLYSGQITIATYNPDTNVIWYNTVNGERVPPNTLPKYVYPPCIRDSIDIKPPVTQPFCDIFPDDPLCVKGCTDPNALNYNPNAGFDDGSCFYEYVYGCTDPDAKNYDPLANTNDGSCIFPQRGCTDPNALNYQSWADIDDGSCIYQIYGCTDPNAKNYDPAATDDDGSCIYPAWGCTDPNALNYDPAATDDDGSCIYTPYGCTDPNAYNYNPAATIDDGSCIYPVWGCTDPNALNYDPNAVFNDGSCIYDKKCESIYVQVVEFSSCGNSRISKTVELLNVANATDLVQVVEFSSCGNSRISKTVELMRCDRSTSQ